MRLAAYGVRNGSGAANDAREESEFMPVDAGTAAPTFALKDANEGQPYDLSQALRRGPVLLAIYKSSCQASKTAFPFLQKILEAYSSDQITVWGIAQDSPNITKSF